MTKGNPTNTLSIDDRELIDFLRTEAGDEVGCFLAQAADRLESLLSERDKLEERVRELLEAWGDGADDARMAPLVIALNNVLNRTA